jgi:hypothetical protein
MTYASITEVILHLNDICIGDSYSEGIYRMRVSMFTEATEDSGESARKGSKDKKKVRNVSEENPCYSIPAAEQSVAANR